MYHVKACPRPSQPGARPDEGLLEGREVCEIISRALRSSFSRHAILRKARTAAVRAGVVAMLSEGWERECEGDRAVEGVEPTPHFLELSPTLC